MDINIKKINHDAEQIAVFIAVLLLCVARLIKMTFIWVNFFFSVLLLLLGGFILTALFFSAFTPQWLMMFGYSGFIRGVLWMVALVIATVLCFLWFFKWKNNGLSTAKSETKKIMEEINGEIKNSEILVRYFARFHRDNSGSGRNTGI